MISFSQLQNRTTPLVIAHRGASKAARENTIEAFQKGIELGADAVEFDVRRTRDMVLIVHHDPCLTGCEVEIAEQTYAEVIEFIEQRGYWVPTVSDALQACAGKIALDIELKESGYERDLIELVGEHYSIDHVLFKSFRDDSVREIRRLAPEAHVGLLLGDEAGVNIKNWLADFYPRRRLATCGASFVSPHWRLIRFGFVARMNRAGLPVLVWTVDDERVARRLAARGVAGIITNEPDRISVV